MHLLKSDLLRSSITSLAFSPFFLPCSWETALARMDLATVNSIVVCIIGLKTRQIGFIPANLFCIVLYAVNVRELAEAGWLPGSSRKPEWIPPSHSSERPAGPVIASRWADREFVFFIGRSARPLRQGQRRKIRRPPGRLAAVPKANAFPPRVLSLICRSSPWLTALVDPDNDEVSRAIAESFDAQAFQSMRSMTVGEFREYLLDDSTTGSDLYRLRWAIVPDMAAAVDQDHEQQGSDRRRCEDTKRHPLSQHDG